MGWAEAEGVAKTCVAEEKKLGGSVPRFLAFTLKHSECTCNALQKKEVHAMQRHSFPGVRTKCLLACDAVRSVSTDTTSPGVGGWVEKRTQCMQDDAR